MLRLVWTVTPFWRMQHSPLIGLVKLFPTRLPGCCMISWAGWRTVGIDGWTDRPLWHIISFDHILLTLCSSFQLCITSLSPPLTPCCSPVSSTVLEWPYLFLLSGSKTHRTFGSASYTVHRHKAKRQRIRRTSGRKNKQKKKVERGTKP